MVPSAHNRTVREWLVPVDWRTSPLCSGRHLAEKQIRPGARVRPGQPQRKTHCRDMLRQLRYGCWEWPAPYRRAGPRYFAHLLGRLARLALLPILQYRGNKLSRPVAIRDRCNTRVEYRLRLRPAIEEFLAALLEILWVP